MEIKPIIQQMGGTKNSFLNFLNEGRSSQSTEPCNMSPKKGNNSTFMDGTLVVSLPGIVEVHFPIKIEANGCNLDSDVGWTVS